MLLEGLGLGLGFLKLTFEIQKILYLFCNNNNNNMTYNNCHESTMDTKLCVYYFEYKLLDIEK